MNIKLILSSVFVISLTTLCPSSIHEVLRDIEDNVGSVPQWKKDILGTLYLELQGIAATPRDGLFVSHIAGVVSPLIERLHNLMSAESQQQTQLGREKINRYIALIEFLIKRKKGISMPSLFKNKEQYMVRRLFYSALAGAYCGCIKLPPSQEPSMITFYLEMLRATLLDQCTYKMYSTIAHQYIASANATAWNTIHRKTGIGDYNILARSGHPNPVTTMITFLESLKKKEEWKR